MKVLAIDSSPGDGNMDVLLAPYLAGIRAAGADVELYHARDLVVYPCCGNLNCTIGTPGKCMAYDDMRWLRPRIGRADALVLASPLYFDGVVGHETPALRSIKKKLAPGTEPGMDRTYEHAVHTTREAVRLRKVVLVSGGGYWEIDDLNPVLTHIKAFCTNSHPGLEWNLHSPRKAILRGELKLGASRSEVEEAAWEAGRKLVDGCKKKALAAPVSTPPSRVRVEWKELILFQF